MNINFDAIYNACDRLAHRIITVHGERHGQTWLFNQCMRAFDAKLPAEAITFSVFFNAPVMLDGFATIHRDGTLETMIEI